MASKLFHTVVGFGIALGAAQAACGGAADGDEADKATSSVVADDMPANPKVTPPPAPADRFCDVAWPTTKGSPPPPVPLECMDPKGACTATLNQPSHCYFTASAAGRCDFDKNAVWTICDGTSWVCPSGTVDGALCAP